MQTLHIHPYGPPGIGKSTLAAAIFAELKIRGINAELVQEYAKELAWRGEMTPDRQALVTIEQLRREESLRGKVEVIVTDSPPLLGVAYALPTMREALRTCVLASTSGWHGIDLLLDRDLRVGAYQQAGRNEKLEASIAKGREIAQILHECGIRPSILHMTGDPEQVRDLAADIAQRAIDATYAMRDSRSLSIPIESRTRSETLRAVGA